MNSVYVRADGCIHLGSKVTCDGFSPDSEIRIQTHAHSDHLKDFERSKGNQRFIVLSEGTFDLLVAEFNADIPHRPQFKVLPLDGSFHTIGDVEVALFPSGHLVGGAIPTVRYSDGKTFAYSSDFSWPLSNLPNDVDVLVVDATYGDPAYIRNYDQKEVVDQFVRLVSVGVNKGRIVVTGHRGRLQAAAQILHEKIRAPFLFSRSAFKTIDVFCKHRSFEAECLQLGDEKATTIVKKKQQYVAFIEFRDRVQLDQLEVDQRIYLSPFLVPREEPIEVHGTAGITRVAMTDHADFQETVKLVEAIGPRHVIADATRCNDQHGRRLADFLYTKMGIPSSSKVVANSREWGKH